MILLDHPIKLFALFICILECITVDGNEVDTTCKFPFRYKGYEYETCIMNDADFLWCYTELYSNGVGVRGKWGNCGPNCEGSIVGKVLHCIYAIK